MSATAASSLLYANRSQLSPSAQATLKKHLPGSNRILQQVSVQRCDVGCLTDVCSSQEIPEVEIFSLLEEQIPKYKIRADSMTSFAGYENQDFGIQCPALKIPTEGLGLTKDQLRETLNYFLLCGNRVSQMTRTYDDIEAVTRLLEEKEKDLELTVQIGKELLTQNNRLEHRVSELESDLKSATENLAQLSHELHQKNELIGILTNDVDDSGSENVTPTAFKSINLDLLQRKITTLEVENKSLRSEVAQVVQETDEVEEAERRLMEDITNQLQSANTQFDGINLELERYKEENRLQHEQIVNLTARLAEAEMRLYQLTSQNEEASSLLCITKENQNLLASELLEFKSRYQEVLALLHDTQEQLRKQRKRSQPMVRSSLIPGIPALCHPDSLQSELMETSLFSDHSLDSGIASENGGGLKAPPAYKKIFETVRCASIASRSCDGMSQLGSMSMSSSSQPRMSSYVYPVAGSVYSTVYGGSSLGGKSFSRESLASDPEDSYPSSVGVPGIPGAKDLEAALKRLTPAEVLARRAMLSHAPLGTYSYDEPASGLPLGFRTPDSIMSTGSSNLSGLSSHWRLPEKLQIIKPLEGSQTLHHWSRLATPTLSGLLDERPGVTIRGGRGLEELGLQTYSLADLEEDVEEQPAKRYESSACVYTYTNSTVLHPDDGTSVCFSIPPSQVSSQMPSECNSRQTSCPPTPRASLSRRNSCSTFSVNSGLAGMLNERGIKAVTPSALNTPTGQNFSPTVTPCNSPDGSPTRSLSPEPTLANILTSGADLFRRKFIGYEDQQAGPSGHSAQQRPSRMSAKNKVALTHLERRALRSIRIMEKVESVGLENICGAQQAGISPLALHGTQLYTSRRTASPMTQLTSFKHLNDNKKNRDELQKGKEAIKAAISKGMSSNESVGSFASSGASSVDLSDISSNTSTTDSGHRPPRTMQQRIDSRKSLAEARAKQVQRQRSRRSLVNGTGGQRPDLGVVGGSTVSAGGAKQNEEESSYAQGFIGTISSLLFGRKGGLL